MAQAAKDIEVQKLICAAETLGRLMVADMANHAAEVFRRHGDEHGAKVLSDFGDMVREDREPAPAH